MSDHQEDESCYDHDQRCDGDRFDSQAAHRAPETRAEKTAHSEFARVKLAGAGAGAEAVDGEEAIWVAAGNAIQFELLFGSHGSWLVHAVRLQWSRGLI